MLGCDDCFPELLGWMELGSDLCSASSHPSGTECRMHYTGSTQFNMEKEHIKFSHEKVTQYVEEIEMEKNQVCLNLIRLNYVEQKK